jgi:ubiquinone/menaquinone biosynthesis C-methylase UbiE
MSIDNTAFIGLSVAEKYERYLGPLLFEPFAEDLVARIKGKNYSEVLEIACGTGRVTRHLRQALPETTKLVATDLQPDMIKVAADAMPTETINWQTADAQQLIFADERFDLVVCQFGLMFMPDKMKATSEIFRVLKKGGRFIFNTWDKVENNGVVYVGNQIICSYFPENPPSFYRVPFSMSQPDQIEILLVAAGFKNVKVHAVEKEGISPSAKEAAIGIVEGNPIYGRIIEKDPKLVEVIRAAVEQKIAEQYGDVPLRSPLKAWVFEATR